MAGERVRSVLFGLFPLGIFVDAVYLKFYFFYFCIKLFFNVFNHFNVLLSKLKFKKYYFKIIFLKKTTNKQRL